MTIYQLYIQALEFEAQEREAFIRSNTNDETIIKMVLRLLSSDNTAFTLSNQIVKESSFCQKLNSVEIGDVISAYKLTDSLGQGGMGAVFKAKRIDGRFEQTVAIKIIPPFFYNNRIINEANFMAKFNHNNICSVNDAGMTDSGLHYIIMEYIDGCDISTYFKQSNFTLNETLTAFVTLCYVVNYAHQMHVIHGDLKPENILIDKQNQIKVLDFGVSQILNHDLSSSDEEMVNIHGISKGFSSPEIINGGRPSVYSDIYALGKVLANLINNNDVHMQKNNYEIIAIINKATSSLPTDRYVSVSELNRDITLYLNGYVVTAYHASKLYKLKKLAIRRHPISTLIGGVISTILMINLMLQYQ